MDGASSSDIGMKKDGKSCKITIVNYSEDVDTVANSYIVGITVKADSGLSFETADGADFTKTKAEIIKIYGEPAYYDASSDKDLVYDFAEIASLAENPNQMSGIKSVFSHSIGDDEMTFKYTDDNNNTSDSMTAISMEYWIEPEETSSTSTTAKKSETTTAKSAETTTAASTDTELGTDVYAGVIQLNDVVYTFPIKVSDLIANGYEFEETGNIPGGRTSEYSTVYYNNLEAGYMYYSNPNKSATPIEDCLVYQVNSENGTLVLPGGIKVGSTFDDVKKAYPEVDGMEDGDNTKKGENRVSFSHSNDNYYIDFSYGYEYYVDITVDASREVVSKISVRQYLD